MLNRARYRLNSPEKRYRASRSYPFQKHNNARLLQGSESLLELDQLVSQLELETLLPLLVESAQRLEILSDLMALGSLDLVVGSEE